MEKEPKNLKKKTTKLDRVSKTLKLDLNDREKEELRKELKEMKKMKMADWTDALELDLDVVYTILVFLGLVIAGFIFGPRHGLQNATLLEKIATAAIFIGGAPLVGIILAMLGIPFVMTGAGFDFLNRGTHANPG